MPLCTMHGRVLVVHLVDDPQSLLVQEVTIECPQCGRIELQLLGHHLRGLHRLLSETIAANPDLCGTEMNKTHEDTVRVVPGDPTLN